MSWSVGVFTFLGLTFYHNRRMARIATDVSVPVPIWVQQIFLECRDCLNIKVWPTLIISGKITSPCLMGAVRPNILLPQSLVESGKREQLRYILLHELIHLKHGDIWLSWFWTLAWSLHWFNPLLWWAGRCMYLDRETACDERVLGILKPERRLDYGRSLIELLRKLRMPARYPGLAGIVERKTNIERRLVMIKQYQKGTTRQLVFGSLVIALLLAVSLTSFAASTKTAVLSSEKAEMMGRVEDFFMHNYRDITARKSLEWGKVETDKKNNRSIRYMCEALIWDKDWKILNQVFTFDAEGRYVSVENVAGYPRDKEARRIDTTTKEGMIDLVEHFFSRNFRDITARKTIEWGPVQTDKNGNRNIRYKYEATIWNEKIVQNNQIFTFTPAGEFVSVEDVSVSSKSSP